MCEKLSSMKTQSYFPPVDSVHADSLGLICRFVPPLQHYGGEWTLVCVAHSFDNFSPADVTYSSFLTYFLPKKAPTRLLQFDFSHTVKMLILAFSSDAAS